MEDRMINVNEPYNFLKTNIFEVKTVRVRLFIPNP